MTTLVLPPRYTGDAQRIWRAATARGWKVMRAMGWRVEPLEGEVVVYGEPMFARAVAEQLGLNLSEPALDWLTTLPVELVHRKITFGTVATALQGAFPRFIKPADDKAFVARVYATSDDLAEQGADPDVPTLTSDPVRFDSEFRGFAIGTEVVTMSLYSRYGDLIEDADAPELPTAKAFAESVLREHLPCGASVVDVGQLAGGEWAVVEANPCWGSGIYACDSDRVLDVLVTSVLR